MVDGFDHLFLILCPDEFNILLEPKHELKFALQTIVNYYPWLEGLRDLRRSAAAPSYSPYTMREPL
jgi:hypothetical protein